MAIVAVITTRYVRRMLAGRRDTVMTRAAAAEYLRMVDGDRRYPDCRAVTILACVCRYNVRRVLAGRSYTVVAVVAVTRNAGVIKVGG